MADTINVLLDQLRTVAPEFRIASQDTLDLIDQLNQVTSNLVGDMYAAQLTRSPDALDTLWNRWRHALYNLAMSMNTVATNLEIAADSYEGTDQRAMPFIP